MARTEDETAASDVEEDCGNTRGVVLKGAQITNAPAYTITADEFPYTLKFDSPDTKYDCVRFEVKTNAGIKPANDQEVMQHIVPVRPTLPVGGAMKYRVRSRVGNMVSVWSESFTVCDAAPTTVAGFAQPVKEDVLPDEYFVLDMRRSR